ncbi:hypothetical protein NP233_g10772 [Leucocoprinus birnbaumii]|uniref:Uncharacterized protein n=1 Tax=Leucocoprinus birnbaumii TaxID=56174 RepID=A0AAD5VI76_9AGAR|nr:hypothetical protein NP233_g10772 [Leucocoprinus birnbaumii]
MKNTFAKLAEYIRKEETNVFIPGRKADHEVQDTMAVGCHKLLEGEVDLSVVDQSEDTSGIEIEVDDDGRESKCWYGFNDEELEEDIEELEDDMEELKDDMEELKDDMV